MPTSLPLPAIARRLRADPWRFLDVRCALDEPHAMAWVRGDAAVCAWGPPPVIHALNHAAYDETAALLSRLRGELPARFELRAGPAGGGVLAEGYHMELLGPVVRMRRARTPDGDPDRFVALGPEHAGEVSAISDKESRFVPRWLGRGGWFGIRHGPELVAAVGPRDTGDGAALLAAPVVAKQARRTGEGPALLAAVSRRLHGDVGIDIRVDRRQRLEWASEAGFEREFIYERWWGVAR